MYPTLRRFLAQSLYPSLQARMLSTRVATHYRLQELYIWQFNDVMFFFRIFKVWTEMEDLRSRVTPAKSETKVKEDERRKVHILQTISDYELNHSHKKRFLCTMVEASEWKVKESICMSRKLN